MTARAKGGYVRQHRLDIYKIGYVRRLWTMTRFTSHVGVFASSPRLPLFAVAFEALSLAGERQRVLADQVQSGGTVMTEFPEILRDHSAPNHQKECQTG